MLKLFLLPLNYLINKISVVVGISLDEQTTQKDLLFRININLNFELQTKIHFQYHRIRNNKVDHRFKN